MTDQELSGLLKEWKRTPAPSTLDARVFGRQVLVPRWWDRIPASVTALSGVAVGGLVVYGLIALTSHQPVVQEPPRPIPVEAPEVRPLAPPTEEKALPPPIPRRVPKPARPPQFTSPAPKPAEVQAPPIVTGSVPRVMSRPSVAFPVGAQGLTVTTNVKLHIRIGKDGHVVDASVTDGDPLLNDAALEAVKGWVYQPYLLNGVPAEQTTDVVVDFTGRGIPKKN